MRVINLWMLRFWKNMQPRNEKKGDSRESNVARRCQVERSCTNDCRSLPLFLFFSDCPTIAMRKRVPTLFEYDHYYENGKSTTIMRDSQRFEQCPRLWTGANGNKTVPERQRRLLVASFVPPSRPACHRVTLFIRYLERYRKTPLIS